MEQCAQFRFYEELNDFLPRHQRKRDIPYIFTAHPAVKDSIEALGVPHTEVDLIIINGRSVGFAYEEYQRCRDCGKVYWRGAHYPRLSCKLERILGGDRASRKTTLFP